MVPSQPLRDLLWRPLLIDQQVQDHIPEPGSGLPPPISVAASRPVGPILSPERPVILPATIGPDLTAHRPPMPTQTTGDLSIRLATFNTKPDQLPLINRQSTSSRFSFSQHDHPMPLDQPPDRGIRDPRISPRLIHVRPPGISPQSDTGPSPRCLWISHKPSSGSQPVALTT